MNLKKMKNMKFKNILSRNNKRGRYRHKNQFRDQKHPILKKRNRNVVKIMLRKDL
jgi:hypothetical protein